jgi:hypothetical protein
MNLTEKASSLITHSTATATRVKIHQYGSHDCGAQNKLPLIQGGTLLPSVQANVVGFENPPYPSTPKTCQMNRDSY